MSFLADPPRRLRRPLLVTWRSPGRLQLGTGDHALVLDGVPSAAPALVELLVTPHTRQATHQLLPQLAPAWIDWLWAHLSSADLLVDANADQPTVAVHGSGTLAASLISGLSRAGVQVGRLGNGSALEEDHPLVVLAPDRVEPDRALVAELTAAGTPHLVVRLEPGRAVVGPLVIPGYTACVRCDDLAHCHVDPCWPLLLAQLCRQASLADATLLGWAVATATAQARSLLNGAIPDALGRCIELQLPDFRLHARSWPADPACGCADRASGSVLGAALADWAGEH